MRLNLWTVIGVVLSAAWLLIGPVWLHSHVENMVMTKNVLRYRECRAGPTDPAVCEAASLRERNAFLDVSNEKWWQLWAGMGLLPVTAIWFLAWVFLMGFRFFARRHAKPSTQSGSP